MLLRPTLSLAALLLAGNVLAAEPLKSGPPVGAGIRGAFFPLHVTGPDAGTRQCPV